MIVQLQNSHIKNKRYRVILEDGSHYDFGLKGGQTYIDHHDKKKRENYWKRHLGNKEEEYKILHLIPSPATFSAYLLWGRSTDINENIKNLNNLMKNSA